MDLKQIETALAAEVIYNVDFVELKSQLNRLIDRDGGMVRARYQNGGWRDFRPTDIIEVA